MLLRHMPQVLREREAQGQMLSTTQEAGAPEMYSQWHVILFIIAEASLFLPTISFGVIRIL